MTNSIKYRLDKPVTLGVTEITVTEGDIYIFDSKEDNKTKDVRRMMNLPVTKTLVYYTDTMDEKSTVVVESMTIDKILTRDDGSNWFVVDIGYEGKNAKLHSAYFSDMQSPTFIDDIKKLEDEQEI